MNRFGPGSPNPHHPCPESSERTRRVGRGALVLLAVVSLAYGLATATPQGTPPAAADDKVETYTVEVPYTETYTVRVPYEETYTVRVPYQQTYTVRVPYKQTYNARVPYQQTYTVRVPYREKYTVSVPKTETYTVRVPYKQTYTVRVPYKQTYRVRVAPLTRTVANYKYKTVCYYTCRRVRVAPFTRTVMAFNYETRTRTAYRNETRTRTAYRNETRTRTRYSLETRFHTSYRTETRTRTAYRNETRTRTAYRNETRTRTAYRTEQRTRKAYREEQRTRTRYRTEQRTRSVAHSHPCPEGQISHGHDRCISVATTTTTVSPTTTTTIPPTTTITVPPSTTAPPTTTRRATTARPVSGPSLVVSGLKCSAATSETLTIVWNAARGAASYDVQSSALPVAPVAVLWDAGGTRSRSGYTHTFSSLGRGKLFTLFVRGVDSEGSRGPVASVKCSTKPRNILELECTANALLLAKFSNPNAGTGRSSSYKLQISKAGVRQATLARPQGLMFVYTGAKHGETYTVTFAASHGTGWAHYIETDLVTCPAITDNWNSPNFFDPDEDCPSNFIGRGICVAGRVQALEANAWRLRGPKFEPVSGERVLLSRQCATNGQTSRTCRETWAENITLLKDPKTAWEALGILEWGTGDDRRRNAATLLVVVAALTTPAGATGAWLVVAAGAVIAASSHHAYYRKAMSGTETLKLFPTVAAAIAAGTPLTTTNSAGCLSPYKIRPRSETITETNTYGSFTDKRVSTYHYCDPKE